MPPLRGARAARANRGQTDVDIMEGLPVRQWRKQPVIMNKNPQRDVQPENNDQNTRWRELPMPKGSELYPPWSQALLRAARAGRILQRNSKVNDEDKDGGEDEDAEGDLDASFVANRWSQLSREAEEPETEYLAKRRKGLPTLYGGWATDGGNVTMRKCKVKKIDAEGNAYLLEVLIPEATTIDGEIEENEDLPIQTPAAGTVIEGLGIANAEGVIVANEHMMPMPPRRRPPIPKRKPKGPGRGRKKKVIIEDGANGTATAVNTTAAAGSNKDGESSLNPDGTNGNGQNEGSINAEGEGEGDDGSEDDEDDGDDGDDNDREDGELSDGDDASRSASPMKITPKPDSPRKMDPTTSLLQEPTVIPEVQITPVAPETSQDLAEVLQTASPILEPQTLPKMDNAIGLTGPDEDVPMTDASTITDEKIAEKDTIKPVAPTLADEQAAEKIPAGLVAEPLVESVAKPLAEPIEVEELHVETASEIKAKVPDNHNPLEGLAQPESLSKEELPQIQIEKEKIDEDAPKGEGSDQDDSKKEEDLPEVETLDNVSLTKPAVPDEHQASEQVSSVAIEKPAISEDDIFGSLERHLDRKDGGT